MEFLKGSYIKELRNNSGKTLKDVAEALNMDPANLSKIENGQRDFDIKKLPDLCDFLNVDYPTAKKEVFSEMIASNLIENGLGEDTLDLTKKKIFIYKEQYMEPGLSKDWRRKEFAHPKAKLRVGTLFSGIGAFESALKRLNLQHKIVFAGDIDPYVRKSYFANYPISKGKWHNDVTAFSAKKHKGKVDIIVGGSPCQAFSMVGKRRGLEDVRGTLFYDFARVVSESQPKIFIFENVKGLLNHDGGRTWKVVQEVFGDLGYKIFSKILNSKDYGIPQHRERIFVIGFKDHNTDFDFPAPIPLQHSMQDFLEDYTDSKYYLKEKGIKFVTSTKNREKSYTQINGDIMLCQKANQQFNWHGDFIFENVEEQDFDDFIFDVNAVEEKYYLSDKVRDYVLAGGTKNFKTSTKTDLNIARPLLQTMHKMHRAGVDNYVTHNKGRIRKLTPRECVRLMGFRDDFKIEVSDTQMYKQAGNSIVVDVFVALLKQMDITKFASKK
jgi:DNA (cytosine-5)-methyltransferase 1